MVNLEADKLATLPEGHHLKFWHASMQEFERQLALTAPVFKHGQPFVPPADPERHNREIQIARLRWIILTATDPRAGGAYEADRKNALQGFADLIAHYRNIGEPGIAKEIAERIPS